MDAGAREYLQALMDEPLLSPLKTCWECRGEGGWRRCAEDRCPHFYGEEGCGDPACWRTCPTCKGRGVT